MVKLADVQKEADQLSPEGRAGLLAYLIHSLQGAPQGPEDREVTERDSEMESGAVTPVSHQEFIAQVRPGPAMTEVEVRCRGAT